MQISAVNQKNFKGNSYPIIIDAVEGRDFRHIDPEESVAKEIRNQDEFQSSQRKDSEQPSIKKLNVDEMYDNILNIDEKISKITKNVHPATVISALVFAAGAAKASSKCIPIGRRLVVRAGEGIATAAVKVATGAVNLVKKNKINPEKALNGIKHTADKLGVDNVALAKAGKLESVTNNKNLNKIGGFVGKVLGEEQGKTAVSFLQKTKMVNLGGVIDGAIAAFIGLRAMDKSADVTEGIMDRQEFARTINELAEFV